MDINDVKILAEQMYERDAADFAFDAMVNKAITTYAIKQSSGNPALDGMVTELMSIVADVLRMVAPDVFHAGHTAGVAAGLEIAREIRR